MAIAVFLETIFHTGWFLVATGDAEGVGDGGFGALGAPAAGENEGDQHQGADGEQGVARNTQPAQSPHIKGRLRNSVLRAYQ